MREARITINIEGLEPINEAICYYDDQEEKKLMGFLRDRVKAEAKKRYGFLGPMMVPKGIDLMREIVKRVNAHFGRTDPLPDNWIQFKMWAGNWGFLSIEEIGEG